MNRAASAASRPCARAVERALAAPGTRHRLGHEDHLSRNGARVRVLESADGEPGRPHADARAAAGRSPPSARPHVRAVEVRASRPGWAGCSTAWTCTSTRSSPRRSSRSCWASPTRRMPRVGCVQLVDPGRVPDRLGAGRRASSGALGDRLGRSRALSLTILTYALFTGLSFFGADLVAAADLPLPGRARDRRRMGGGVVAAVGDLAQALAALDRGRAPDGRQHRRAAGRQPPST